MTILKSKKKEPDFDNIKQWARRLGLSLTCKEMLDNILRNLAMEISMSAGFCKKIHIDGDSQSSSLFSSIE
jgi:hypothetical protein